MHYTEFRIRNFKGIRDTEIKLLTNGRAGVFTFVGLNESGKTTILEAIHSFSPDHSTSLLVGGDASSGVPFEERVPRHLLSHFSDDISVTAKIFITDEDKEQISRILQSKHNLLLDPADFPDFVMIERHQRFKSGDFQKNYFTLRTEFKVRTKRQRSWRPPNNAEKASIRDVIYSMTPDIAYFPTFVFNFPKSIFLTEERGDRVNNFYRRVFQDILDFEGSGLTIEESIVRRVRSSEKKVSWLDFLSIWTKVDDNQKIQHVMDRASAVVTDMVFGRWNKIFGEDAKGKEINISFEVMEGEIKDASGVTSKTMEHDIAVKFQIKDGTRRFDVNDRSLGFRWFFSFMLFTQFRAARDTGRATLFLFDEPAANLHAAAQQKLLDSFPEITKRDHVLAYSTHSHYMVDPRWLEQTFIVTNRSDQPIDSVLDTLSLSDESLDIRATSYRSFASNHPNQTSYFQPILDRLQVVPSRFDILKPSIIVEGKSDYYVIRYALALLGEEELPLIPAFGAGTLGALISLQLGWALKILIVLDSDAQGRIEKDRYISEYGVSPLRLKLLSDLSHGLSKIESLLDEEARALVSRELREDRITKKAILRFFQERIARDEIVDLGENFRKKSAELITGMRDSLEKVKSLD